MSGEISAEILAAGVEQQHPTVLPQVNPPGGLGEQTTMNYSLNLLGYDDSMILHYGGVNLGLACHHNSFSVSIGCVTMLRTVLHLPLQDEFKTAGALTLFVSVFC